MTDTNHTLSQLHRIRAYGMAARICVDYGTTLEAVLVDKRRRQRATRARDHIIAILRWSTTLSLTELGDIFNMDHSSVQLAITRHERVLNNEPRQDAKLQLLKKASYARREARRPGVVTTHGETVGATRRTA